jgi:hypothetical protein
MGYLQVFQDSLPVDGCAAGEGGAVVGAAEVGTEEEGTITALLTEYVRMRSIFLPKKVDLEDLNNWQGIMLLDAASNIMSMIINNRLQRLLKEIGIEEQSSFSGGLGYSFYIRLAL